MSLNQPNIFKNKLKPNLPNKMKQGSLASPIELPQGRPESTNKKTGGFFKPTVKRRAPVISSTPKMRKFHFMDENIAEFNNMTGYRRPVYNDNISDDELLKMTPSQIRQLETKRFDMAEQNKQRDVANRRAGYRAQLDTFRDMRDTARLIGSPPIGKMIYGYI